MKRLRLLNRLSLLPQESLGSLLGRLATANYYKPLNAIVNLCLDQLNEPDSIGRPQQAETWAILSEITSIPEKALYEATVHRYAAMFAPPWEAPKNARYVANQHDDLFSIHDARYCPCCIREQLYHRVPWQNRYVAICLKHNCLLQRGCPSCGCRVSVIRLVRSRCHRCQFEFVKTKALDASSDERAIETHQILQSLFGDATPPEVLPPNLLKQPVPIMVELLRCFISTLRCIPTVWQPENYAHPPEQRPRKVGIMRDTKQLFMFGHLAMEVLMDWPHSFVHFLETRRHSRKNPTGLVAADLGNVYSRWIEVRWNRPEFAFLQTVFDDYLVENFAYTRSLYRLARYQENPAFRERFPYLSPTHAEFEFKIPADKVKALMEQGEVAFRLGENLRTYEVNGQKFVSRGDLLALVDATARLIPLDEVAFYLNTTKVIVQALADHSLLILLRFQILADSLNDFVRRLAEVSMRSLPFESAITARQVISRLKLTVAEAIPQILRAIFYKQVRCFWGKGGLAGLQVCVDDLSQIPLFAELAADKNL